MREEHGHRGRHHREDCRNRDGGKAQTFRRGRAIAFLEKLTVTRATLQRQLNDPSFDAIKPVISGELKATEAIMEEFIRVFQLHELPEEDNSSEETSAGEEVSGSESIDGSDES
ncbi:hypothetical protein [Paenibacillus glycanilyticus]|uniref:Uncharacterized protein n=1 Tax=Paenibacillus glycanilyticus TaxID=126569 RepID=A0ABQ6GBD7_9BACL|nr:hypothetical protein [Paenibacillus glycanilyticus]GLX68188.1 hypothetical protein MU1_25330 [Paenibacillus glycanilyticus]